MLSATVEKDGKLLLKKTMPFNSIDIEATNSLYSVDQIIINAKKGFLTIDYFDDEKILLRSIKSTNYLGANISYDDFKENNIDMLNHIIEFAMMAEDTIMNASFMSSYWYELHLIEYLYGTESTNKSFHKLLSEMYDLLSETYVYDYIHIVNFLITIEHVYGTNVQEIFIKNKDLDNSIDNDICIYSDGLVEINNSEFYHFKDNNNVKKDEDEKDNDEYYKLSIFKVDENGKIFELCGSLLPHNKYIKDLNELIEIFKSYVEKNKNYFYTIIKETFNDAKDNHTCKMVLSGIVSEDDVEKIEALKK